LSGKSSLPGADLRDSGAVNSCECFIPMHGLFEGAFG
jgi:hypothetical protein